MIFCATHDTNETYVICAFVRHVLRKRKKHPLRARDEASSPWGSAVVYVLF